MITTIYHKDGTPLRDANGDVVEVHGLEYSDAWMGECFVNISIKHNAPIDFCIGDYIMYRGERFELNYDPGKTKQSSINTYGEGFVYDGVKFNSMQDELGRTDFLDVVLGGEDNNNHLHYTTLPKFSFYVGTVDDLLDRIQENLDEQIGKGAWKIFSRKKSRSMQRGCTEEEWNAVYGTESEDTDDFDSKTIEIDSKTCWEALAIVNEQWDINFVVMGRNIHVGTAGITTEYMFRYGLGNGLYEIDQNADSEQRVITRLRAYGSSKNLPDHYYADLDIKCKLEITGHSGDGHMQIDTNLPYNDGYFNRKRQYTEGNDIVTEGWAVKITFDFETFVTARVENAGNNPATCRIIVEHKEDGSDDNGKEDSQESIDKIKEQISDGFTTLYLTHGVYLPKFPEEHKIYDNDLPNNMAINRLMLPGFPKQSLKDFWDSMTEEEKKYVNPTGREHIFSEDPHMPYIDSLNIEKIGLRSSSQFFDTEDKKNGIDEIYPTIEEMTVGGVRVDEIYKGTSIEDNGRFDDETVPKFSILLNPAVNFDINDLKTDSFSISMKDGKCGGRTFSVSGATMEGASWKLTLERVKDDSLDLYFPYKGYQIEQGDHFVLEGIELPESYIRAAALKLLKYAIALLDKNDYTRYVYQPKVDELFMARQHDQAMNDKTGTIKSLHDTLKAGDIMQFTDDDLHINAKITIDLLTIKEEDGKIPTYEITLREDKEVGTIQKIQQQISSLESGNGKGVAGLTTAQVKNIVAAEGSLRFLSKLVDDTASGFITFLKGIQAWGKSLFESIIVSKDLSVAGNTKLGEPGTKTTFGEFTHDSTGAQIAVDEDGTSRAEFDFITIRRAADFREITIRELKYIGGELAITPAAMEVSKVEKVAGGYRCYFETEDGNGKRKMYQEFLVGDQARCQQFAMKDSVQGERKTTKYYWRLVTEVGEDYIVLSDKDGEKDAQELGNSVPEVGDNIVQLGYQGSDRPNRQSALIFSATAQDAPSSKYYQGINSFSLGGCVVKDEGFDSAEGTFSSKVYGDAFIGDKEKGGYLQYDAESKTMTFKGTAHFDSATMGEDGQPVVSRGDLANLGTHSGNLLLNTSFLGDFESEEISDETDITEDKQMYSSSVKHWEMVNASINGDEDSASGRSVTFSEGGGISQAMKKPLEVGAHYILSFRGKGTKVTIHVGGEEHEVTMSEEVKRYSVPFTAAKLDALFALACDHGTIMEIILTEGNVIAEWTPSFDDNDRSLQELQNYQYLAHAISEGSTTIDGGLVLSEQFRVGNYRNRNLQKETGGMSGIYNSEDSPFIWGGGDMRRAIYTIQRYKGNETATISEEEVREKMANFVVTHGGRLILQDVIARGYIYAEGGVMKSVKSPNGNFEIDEQGNVRLKGHIEAESGKIGAFSIGYEEGEKNLGSVIYYGISSFNDWASESDQDIAIMSQNSFRVGFSFLGGTYGRAAMGRNCDPTATEKIPGASVLYAGYNGGFGGRLYQPVMKIEAMSEQGEGLISARLIGGVQVHQGGIMEQGQCVTETDAEDIDISKGSTIILRNGDGSKVRWYFIPTYEKACQQLGVDGGIAFAVTIKLLCALSVNGCSNKACIANRAEDGTGKVGMEQAGRFIDNNGNEWGIGSRYLEQGDCMEIALVYTPETGYYAQVIYKHD